MTDEQVRALVDAVDQCLDDMGKDGQCVCLYAKALLRTAFEPFRTEDRTDEFPLSEAEKVLAE